MSRRRRSRWLLLPLALVVPLMAACGKDGPTAGANGTTVTTLDANAVATIPAGVKITIGDQGGSLETPLRLSGQLDDLPYKVSFATFASGPLVNEAIAAGDVDLGTMGDTPALLSYASGLDTVVAGVRVTEGSGAAIVAADGSGITSLQDLKGKRVAYTTGTSAHGLVLRALDEVGLTEKDIDQVDVPLTDLANVLGSRQADAAVVYSVFLPAYLAQHPHAVTLVESNDLVPTYVFLLARRASVEDAGKRAALEDLVGRLARANDWVDAHPEQWIQDYYVKVLKQPPAAARAAYEAQGAYRWVPVGGNALADQQAQADLLFANGRLPKRVDLTRQFDPQYATRFSKAIANADTTTDTTQETK